MPPAEKTWAARLLDIRERSGLSQEQLGRQLGITREWVSKLERGREEASELIRIKIEALEKENLPHSHVNEPPQADYRNLRSGQAGAPAAASVKSAGMVDPRHAPPPSQPGPQQLTDEFLLLVGEAAHQPGALGWLWGELRDLRRRYLDRFDSSHDP